MKASPELLELTVDRPVHGGRCVAYPDAPEFGTAPGGDAASDRAARRRVVLVAGAIPGERVRARVEMRKGVAFGDTVQVLTADVDRVPAPAHPGLDLGHVAYARQLVWKREVLEDAMRRSGLEAPEHSDLDAAPSPATWGYRNAIQPAVGEVGERGAAGVEPADATALGYRRPGGRDVVVLADDPTANEACRTAWRALAATRLPRGVVEVSLRGNDAGEALATLVATTEARAALDAAHALVAAGVHGVGLAPYDARGRFRGGAQRLAGARTILQRYGDVELTLTATAFAQPNPVAAGVLFRQLAAWAPAARHALDLYAGSGVIGMHLAPRVDRVTCLEIDRGAVDRGRADAARLGLTNVYHVRLDVRDVQVPDDVDLIVVDPPRAGLAAATRAAIAGSRARTLLYVACDVATWARDVADLTQSGFRLDRLKPYDFQPHTHHLELASRLVRGGSGGR
ncbi:MAG: class I SAM-dependent RNA methyltransferase [Trueperaceae bacterium]